MKSKPIDLRWFLPLPRPKVDPNGCWFISLRPGLNGYIYIGRNGKRVLAHRLFYTAIKGPIPEDLIIDHICRVRHCVNPNHLEPVTPRENTLRGESPSAKQAKRTHCIRNHPLEGDNLYFNKGHRTCLACNRLYIANLSEEQKEIRKVRRRESYRRYKDKPRESVRAYRRRSSDISITSERI